MTTLTDPFEIIAAFVDGERVDPAMLKAALAKPEARDYLVEMVALREVVAHDGFLPSSAARSRPRTRWIVASAAAIVLSLAGGYTLGQRWAAANGAPTVGPLVPSAANEAAPPPTRVIEVAPGDSQVGRGGH
jgi:hypothetical protein